ncbi:MAG TPA: GNAT family N-acetyltransferase [Candidatus Dormibacteraeota bacterium]|jgi:GNAT superfamily N-acetyltransferase
MTLSEAAHRVGTPEHDEAVEFLRRDRAWAAYPLGYLDPAGGTTTEVHGLSGPQGLEALVVIAHLPSLLNIFATGEPRAVSTVLAEMPRLPASGVFSARAEVLDSMERHLQVTTAYRMRRMRVRQNELRPRHEGLPVRLGLEHLDQVRRLYGLWTDNHQLPGQLSAGVYYGVFFGDQLVSAAGTHALSLQSGVGAIGNVLTHASHRGQGLASSTTTAVAQELFARGCEDVVLNVRQGNDIALVTYQKLGFTDCCTFIEGVFHARVR